MRKFMDRITDKILNISPLHFSIIINTLLLIIYLIFGNIKYEVSDDFIMQLIVSGKYSGNPSPEIIFMNISVGYILSSLYKILPMINWYFWFHTLVIFSSLLFVSYFILKEKNNLLTKFLIFSFLCFFSPDLYLLVQFTKTATIAMATSSVLFFLYFYSKKKSNLYIGSLFLFIGLCIRKSCIYLFIPYFLLLLVIYIFLEKKLNKSLFIKIIIVFSTIFLEIISINALNTVYINNHPSYKTYTIFNSYRSKALDYPYYEYSYNIDKLEKLGLNENDYINFIHWNYYDSEIYDAKLFKDIFEILEDYRSANPPSKKESIKILFEREYYKYISFLGCLLIFIIGACYYKFFTLSGIISFLGTGIIFFLFAYMGRIVYRVEYSVFLILSLFMILLTIFLPLKKNNIKKHTLISISLSLIILRFPLYIGNQSNSFYTMFFSAENDINKYNCQFNNNNLQNDFIDELKNHPNNLYFFGFQTMIQSYYLNFNPINSVESIYFDNVIFITGVETNHPEWNAKLKHWNISNPAKALLLDNVYFVENVDYENTLISLNDHSQKEIEMELYKELNGYKIWKFREK